MIKFKQKEFIAPLLALTAAGTGASLLQGNKQQKELERQGEENAKAAERQAELIKEQNRKLERIADKAGKDPQSAVKAAEVIKEQQQRSYSGIGAALKTVGTAAKGAFGKGAMSNIKMGAAVGGTTYVAGRLISRDMKKNGMEIDETGNLGMKSYSKLGSLTKVAKDVGRMANKNKGTIAFGAAIGGAPLGLNYTADKAQLKDQIIATNQAPQQRMYASLGFLSNIAKSAKGMTGGIKQGLGTFKSHPGRTLSGAASNLGSFGITGTKNVQKFSRSLAMSNNKALSKAGNWMTKHKTAANLISIAPGAAAAKLTWDGSTKATEKVAESLDPAAFEYKNSKDQQVQQN